MDEGTMPAMSRQGPPRITAYLLSGTQVCAAGVGQGSSFGTYPGVWDVQDVISTSKNLIQVIGQPKNGETPEENKHWKYFEEIPSIKSVHFQLVGGESVVGVPRDRLDFYKAVHLTLMTCEAQIPFEEKSCNVNLDEVPTPPTPS